MVFNIQKTENKTRSKQKYHKYRRALGRWLGGAKLGAPCDPMCNTSNFAFASNIGGTNLTPSEMFFLVFWMCMCERTINVG